MRTDWSRKKKKRNKYVNFSNMDLENVQHN